MPLIPDLTRTCRTDEALPPHCSAVSVVRKPPGATFLWTITLGWSLDDESIASVVLPPPFQRDRGDILAAMGGDGPAYTRGADLQEEVQARIDVRVGAEKLPILSETAATVKRISVSAAEGTCRVKVLLRVDVPRTLAPEMLDLIDADCDLHVTTNEELFGGAPQGGQVDDEAVKEEEEAPRQETLAQARRRRAVQVDELPPEPEDADLDEVG